MGTMRRCEWKCHPPYEGEVCPRCEAREDRAGDLPLMFGMLGVGIFLGFLGTYAIFVGF